MQTRNPYAAPRTRVSRSDSADDYGEIKLFSAEGRLGRVRYIGYSFAVTFLGVIALAIVGGLIGAVAPDLAEVVTVVGWLVVIVLQILLTIQRAHDMNVTGWLWLISLIPIGALVFWVVPGTWGENNYGKAPPPNTMGAVVLACILPIIIVVGIVAASTVPAIQNYAERAAASTQQTRG